MNFPSRNQLHYNRGTTCDMELILILNRARTIWVWTLKHFRHFSITRHQNAGEIPLAKSRQSAKIGSRPRTRNVLYTFNNCATRRELESQCNELRILNSICSKDVETLVETVCHLCGELDQAKTQLENLTFEVEILREFCTAKLAPPIAYNELTS